MNAVDSAVVEIYGIMNVADVSIPPDEAELVAACLRRLVERTAHICEAMVVGGRAWTAEQQVAADALFAAAETIRTKLFTEGRAHENTLR
jgi:hypothetical protein